MFPIRYLVLLMTFLVCCTVYVTRYNLNVAIVSMVYKTANETGSVQNYCSADDRTFNETLTSTNVSVRSDIDQRYEWSPETQGIILGAFTASYVLCQTPAGRLVEVIGSKLILSVRSLN